MIDLSLLPPPELYPLDYEASYARMAEQYRALYPEWSAELESEPVVKLLELAAYNETMLRAAFNDGQKGVMLAFARGSNLEHLAALLDVERLVIDPGDPEADPPRDPVLESDDRLRLRTQMALEGMAAAGPIGAYRFHALSASARVADVSIDSPTPGTVRVAVLADDGTADAALLNTVRDALNAEDVRPLCDLVQVLAASLKGWQVSAVLTPEPGPDPAVALAAAGAALAALAKSSRRIGRRVPLSAIYAALHQPGIARVTLATPTADVVCTALEAPELTASTLNLA